MRGMGEKEVETRNYARRKQNQAVKLGDRHSRGHYCFSAIEKCFGHQYTEAFFHPFLQWTSVCIAVEVRLSQVQGNLERTIAA